MQLNAGGSTELRVADGHTTLLVVQQGTVLVNGDTPAKSVELVLFDRAGETIGLRAESDARVLMLSGKPLGEPIVGQGPFVMNTREEIRQAIDDFQAGRMGHLA